jgi:3-oxoacyl-[acyl-carrier-protein] synthase-1
VVKKSAKKLVAMKIKKHIRLSFKTPSEITELYRSLQINYPKFFKMDSLSKLGFVASELIFKDTENRFTPREDMAMICFNRSSCLDTDMQFEATIRDNENYFPSPSLFVYTLPNIVIGEIAIRNKFYGESFFYLCENFDARQIVETVKLAFYDKTTTTVLAAWIEHLKEKSDLLMMLIENENGNLELTEEQVNKLYYA